MILIVMLDQIQSGSFVTSVTSLLVTLKMFLNSSHNRLKPMHTVCTPEAWVDCCSSFRLIIDSSLWLVYKVWYCGICLNYSCVLLWFHVPQVRIALQMEDGSRLQGSFSCGQSLWELLTHFPQIRCVYKCVHMYKMCVCVCVCFCTSINLSL